MFITHDFGVVAEVADRVVVMQQGARRRAGQRRSHSPSSGGIPTRAADGGGAAPHRAATAETVRQQHPHWPKTCRRLIAPAAFSVAARVSPMR